MAGDEGVFPVRADGFVPKERYTTREFAQLEHERLWSKVWQIACRTDQVAADGDFIEYTIGDETVVITRARGGVLHAFHNACLHRGRRLLVGAGACEHGTIKCPYHGWCYSLGNGLVNDLGLEIAQHSQLPEQYHRALARVHENLLRGA